MLLRTVAFLRLVVLMALGLSMAPASALAGETLVAVAANFTKAAKEIATAFEADSGHQVRLSFGSTGKLYAQIAHGAPFEVFLAADAVRPALAEENGLAVPGSRFTYAQGRIVLYSREDGVIDAAGEILRTPERIDRLALANPKTAPYGAAAIQTMTALGVLDGLRPRFVRGDSIAQTFQFVVTGNAPVGFVAVAQVQDREGGSRWMVPPELYDPIVQDAVLLKTGADNPAAQAFHRFLQSDAAREIIARNGYGLDDQEP